MLKDKVGFADHLSRVLVATCLALPMLLIILRSLSFNAHTLDLLTIKAFFDLSPAGVLAIRNSLIVAMGVAIASTGMALLIVLAWLMCFGEIRNKHIVILLAPLALPEIMGGVGWNAVFAALGVPLGLSTIIIAQASYGYLYALMVHLAGAAKIDPDVLRLARSLTRSPAKWIGSILLPSLAPYFLAAFILTFVLSLDDFILAFFAGGPGAQTLTIHLFSVVRRGFSVELFVLATLLMGASLILALVSELILKGATQMRLTPRALILGILLLSIALAGIGCKPAGNQEALRIYNWNDYMIPEVLAEFEAEFGVRVIHDIFSSNDELYAKVQRRNSGYDVVVPSDYMVSILIREGLVAPIHAASIDNFSNISPEFKSLSYDPGNKYSVPYFFGSTGIAYNSSNKELAAAVKKVGYGVFFDPSFSWKFTMVDDMRYGLALPLKYKNLSVNTTSAEEIDSAAALLLTARPRIFAFSGDTYIDLLARGEIDLAYGYSGDVVGAAKGNSSIHYTVPASGTTLGVDNLCILAESRNKDLARKFINFVLRPKNHARIANGISWGCPNQAARKFITPALLSNPAIYLPASIVGRSTAIKDVGPEAEVLYERAWSKVVER